MRLIDADALIKNTILNPCHAPYIVKQDVDNATTVSGWISVKDRMPDVAGYECLVCAVNENTNQTHIFTAFTGYGEPGWWTYNVTYMSKARSPRDNSIYPALKITHWMPLPKAPKEDEK